MIYISMSCMNQLGEEGQTTYFTTKKEFLFMHIIVGTHEYHNIIHYVPIVTLIVRAARDLNIFASIQKYARNANV